MILRPYQKELYQKVREAFRGRRSVMMQLATGGGKTRIFAAMAHAARERQKIVWIMVPRNELLRQASETLLAQGVNHGMIAAGFKESKAFGAHIVSKNTLIRRYDKIKVQPDFIIIDEAHLALDRYLEIAGKFPDAKILGVTATPERLDGRGLAELYEDLVEGPPITDLIEMGYLTPTRYFCPPIEGLKQVKRSGTEYDPEGLEALLNARKIYGDAIKHYQRHAEGKPTLVFCRSIKAADETAQKFNLAGYNFENIDGTMSALQRKTLISAMKEGKIQGLTSCELITYGLDVPRVECIIQLRPTLSRTLFCQMIGRGLRPFPGKKECVVFDHVGNYQEHGHPLAPYEWKFTGVEKRKKEKIDPTLTLKLCPQLDYLYCEKKSCVGCEYNEEGVKSRAWKTVNTQLKEVESPVKLTARPLEERQEIQDRIGVALARFEEIDGLGLIDPGPVGDLLKIARILGRSELWVYNYLNQRKHMINMTLLHEIARQKGHKPGWVYFKKKEMKEAQEKKKKNPKGELQKRLDLKQ